MKPQTKCRLEYNLDLKLLYFNGRSILGKIDELKIIVEKGKYDLIAITETWLTNEINNELIALPGYTAIRQDRDQKRGGGVLMYIREPLTFKQLRIINREQNEIIWCEINLRKPKTLILGCTYRAPNCNEPENKALYNKIREVCLSHPNSTIVLVGDFNLPKIDWKNLIFPPGTKDFEDLINDCLFQQHTTQPNRLDNILDLVLTRNLPGKLLVNNKPAIGKSDHDCLSITITIPPSFSNELTKEKIYYTKLCYDKVDWNYFNSILNSRNWEKMMRSSNIEECWNEFKNNILKTMETAIPKVQIRKRPKRLLWINNEAIEYLNRKKQKWKLYRKS